MVAIATNQISLNFPQTDLFFLNFWYLSIPQLVLIIFGLNITVNFTLSYDIIQQALHRYSEYQLFLYQSISKHQKQGLTFNAITEWLNKEGYLTVRGKKFRSAHVHSILKKRLAKEELLKLEYPPVWSDFSMEVVDKTVLMSDFRFPNRKK